MAAAGRTQLTVVTRTQPRRACDLGAAYRNRTDDLFITRSFRFYRWPAAVLLRPHVAVPLVTASDCQRDWLYSPGAEIRSPTGLSAP
jgi:hypothetical protein